MGTLKSDTYCVSTCPTGTGSAPINTYTSSKYYSRYPITVLWMLPHECTPWLLFNQT